MSIQNFSLERVKNANDPDNLYDGSERMNRNFQKVEEVVQILDAQSKAYTDEAILKVTETGIPKLSHYRHELKATVDNQKNFDFNNPLFESISDFYMVFVGPNPLKSTEFSFVETGTLPRLVLVEGVSLGTVVTIIIMKNVPVGPEGSINAVVLSDGTINKQKLSAELQSEIGGTSIKETDFSLKNGYNYLDAPLNGFAKIKLMGGRTIVNHAPLFTSGLWYFSPEPSPGKGEYVVVSPNEVNLTKSDNTFHNAYVIVKVKPNTVYTVSSEKIGFQLGIFDKNSNPINDYSSARTITFNTGNNSIIRIYIHSLTTGLNICKNISLVEGSEELPFVADIKGITNPTVQVVKNNMIPPFKYHHINPKNANLEIWSYLSNLADANKDNVSWSNSDSFLRVLVKVEKGNTYTFSCITDSNFVITSNNGDSSDSAQLKVIHEETVSVKRPAKCTFTITDDSSHIRILFSKASGYLEKPMMNLGSLELPYKMQETESTMVKTTLYDGDVLSLTKEGLLVERKNIELTNLWDLNWVVASNDNDRKYITANVDSNKGKLDYGFVDHKEIVSDGLGRIIIPQTGVFDIALGGSWAEMTVYIGLVVDNVDSGWGPNYTPTLDEIRAYLLGWLMHEREGALYNGTGVKAWGKKYCGIGTKAVGINGVMDMVDGSGILNVPLSMNDLGFKPHKAVHKLKKSFIEPVESLGSITLDKGINVIKVKEDMVLRETVRPHYYYDSSNVAYNRYEIGTLIFSELSKKPLNILNVYKNGMLDKSWTDSNEKVPRKFLAPPIFDPTAVYSVDYIVDYPFLVSAPINTITIEYKGNLGSVVEDVVETASELVLRTQVVEQSMVRKDAPVERIKAFTTNLTRGEIAISKNSMGIVEVFIYVHDATWVGGKVIGYLPKGYFPRITVAAFGMKGNLAPYDTGAFFYIDGINGTVHMAYGTDLEGKQFVSASIVGFVRYSAQ